VGFKVEYEDKDDQPGKRPDEDSSKEIPENWKQYTFEDVDVPYTGEDWARKEKGIKGHKNWLNFIKDFADNHGKTIHFVTISLWVYVDILSYNYCAPVEYETNFHLKEKEEELIKLKE